MVKLVLGVGRSEPARWQDVFKLECIANLDNQNSTNVVCATATEIEANISKVYTQIVR